ncbi:hypothetical protein TUM17576_32410 [Enterobacter hormaechei]|nr:hypothetical protein TUM17576_32410 [Enterobacter hormaechei]
MPGDRIADNPLNSLAPGQLYRDSHSFGVLGHLPGSLTNGTPFPKKSTSIFILKKEGNDSLAKYSNQQLSPVLPFDYD